MKKQELKEQLHEQGIIIDCLDKIVSAYQDEIKEISKKLNKKLALKTINIKNETPFQILAIAN
jgi:hypothetical protein